MPLSPVRRLALGILALAVVSSLVVAGVAVWSAKHALVSEKGIDEIRLISVGRSTATIEVSTTNRGCPAERFVRLDSKQSGYRIDIRAYYREIPGVGSGCAMIRERHNLILRGLSKGSFTVFAPTTGTNLKPKELTFEVS